MKLHIFQSGKGDCFLLESKDGKLVLCDAGMGPAYRTHVRPALGKMRVQQKELDLVYVSHVDNDHISGVKILLEDEAQWRVYDHKKKKGDAPKKPVFARPPKVKGILHNGFRDQIGANSKSIESLSNAVQIERLLMASAPALYATNQPKLMHVADDMHSIATGIPESLEVTMMVDPDALNIPLNRPPGVQRGGKLLRVGRPGEKFKIGAMQFTLIGPTEKELKDLRDGWQNWLRSAEGKKRVKAIRAEVKKRVDDFSNGSLDASPFDLGGWNGIPDYESVTVPNIASIMFMVEEDNKRLLLTGDAQQKFIIEGLERAGFLPKSGALHINVLKVQHHGSENNLDADFVRRVSADHYVFGANGEHENPDLRVLKDIFDSRCGPTNLRTLDPKAATRPFTWWFSTSSAVMPAGNKSTKYFREVEDKVESYVARAKGLLKVRYNKGSSVRLSI